VGAEDFLGCVLPAETVSVLPHVFGSAPTCRSDTVHRAVTVFRQIWLVAGQGDMGLCEPM
jgi:hypothetical protein